MLTFLATGRLARLSTAALLFQLFTVSLHSPAVGTHICANHYHFYHVRTIDHILTKCIDFQPIRVHYYSTSDISQTFSQGTSHFYTTVYER